MGEARRRALVPAREPLAIPAPMLAHARAFIRRCRDQQAPWFGIGVRWLDRDERRVWLERFLRTAADDPRCLADLCNRAREEGAGLAHGVLVQMIYEYGHNMTPMPLSLAAYNQDVILPLAADPSRRLKRKRGPKTDDPLMRAIALLTATFDLCWKFGLHPTRNRSGAPSPSERVSGCVVVAEAYSRSLNERL